MNKTLSKILTCLSIGTILCGLGSWIYIHDQSMARAASVTVLRTELRILNEKHEAYKQADRQQRLADQDRVRARDVEKRIWVLEQSFPDVRNMPYTSKEELFRLKQELKDLRNK